LDLSIVIVNYNVSFFLEQCLHSVQKAKQHLQLEVFVVDNNSQDGSPEMVREKFPWVLLISNQENFGFSKANNQALKLAVGKYALLLNPDTVVAEDTFVKCFEFMEKTANAGALGVKMIDGKGDFLPESKRSLPTPEVAFYKIFGLSNLFPKSKRFAKYHLGYLPNNQNHKIEILSGAFMFMRMETLKVTGFLDETYFMYGEDIDLSYKILKAGFDNYYFSETQIIHYKGESTKKGSLNYVFVFYKAMIIFAKKHFTAQNARLYSFIINLAIYFRAFTAILTRIFKALFTPFVDFALLALVFYETQKQYGIYADKVFPEELIFSGVLFFPCIWIVSIFLSGGYDKPFQQKYLKRGLTAATFVAILIYALLSEEYRFSRVVLLFSVIISLGAIYANRFLLNILPFVEFKTKSKPVKRTAIVASPKNMNEVYNLFSQSSPKNQSIFKITTELKREPGKHFAASLSQLKDAISIYRINEVIFSSASLSNHEIMEQMQLLKNLGLEFKIALNKSNFIIGSNSINTTGEYYSLLNFNNINTPTAKRNKRIFDVVTSSICLVSLPITILFQANKKAALINIFNVFRGSKSWVGFGATNQKQTYLPKIKKGIFFPNQITNTPVLNEQEIIDQNIAYAQNFSIQTDWKILLNNLTNLD
jgi:GT2 family glycosyltransferase